MGNSSMTEIPGDIVRRYQAILANADAAMGRAGREGEPITLVAVSKTVPAEAIAPLIEAGHRVFGENRVQEAAGKWPALRERYDNLELHLVGPLQSNKAADAVALFDVIETVDRPKIAAAIAREIDRQGRQLSLMVQVNTGGEQQKAGVPPEETAAFVERCASEFSLEISGLMCIPPLAENPGPHFALLAKLAGECGLSTLSMGMSADFGLAVAFGATHIRVGSAIFGERQAQREFHAGRRQL
jgi:PLP dependent protein